MTRPDPHASYRQHVSSEAEAVEEDDELLEILDEEGRNGDGTCKVAAATIRGLRAQLSRAIARDSGGYAPDGKTWKQAVMDEAARRGEADAQLATARNALEEGSEILVNLMESVRKHGNYSPETTIQFIDQALQCFRPGAAKRDLAALNSGEQKQIEDWPYPEGNPTCAQDLK